MPDALVRLRSGESRPVYGQAVAESGSTITLASGATYSLYDAAGVVVTGHDEEAVTGYETGALASPRLWVVLDTTTPALLEPGYYTLVFAFTGTGSDGIEREFRVSVGVQVLAATG